MIGPEPKFIKSPFFVAEPGNWHLKPGAPADVRREFKAFMDACNPQPPLIEGYPAFSVELDEKGGDGKMRDGAKLFGTIKCKRCERQIKWYHLIPQRVSDPGLFSVSTIKEDEAGATVTRKENGIYQMYVSCKHCGATNEFTYEDK